MPTQSEISLSPQSAKGDILTSDGSSRTRFPVGANDKIITAVSSASSGLGWDVAAAGSGTRTLISVSNISSSIGTVEFTNIPQTYSHLQLIITNTSTVATSTHTFTVNGGTTTAISQLTMYVQSTNSMTYGTTAGAIPSATGFNPDANLMAIAEMYLINYSDTSYNKNFFFRFGSARSVATETNIAVGWMRYNSNSAITSIKLTSSNAAGIGPGSCYSLYGIKG